MSRRLRIRPAASADVRAARQWYEDQRPGLGDRFYGVIRAAIVRIHALPFAHPVVYRDIHRVALQRFPYSIFYRVNTQVVTILRIIHQKRDPRIWPGR